MRPAVARVVLGGGLISRSAFLAGLSNVLGPNQRILYVPNGTDTTTSVESSTVGRTFTWDADISGRRTALGGGYVQAFNGTSQYGECPDADDLSFGNGTVDSAFSVLALVNIDSVAAVRNLLSKTTTNNREYRLGVLTNGTLILSVWDESALVTASRISSASITVGGWQLLAVTYDGTGGASAMNGATLYQNGQVFASSATNNASYVAMENLAATVEIGARVTHSQDWLSGSLGMVALTQKALTASEHQQIAALCRRHFGVIL